MSNIVLLSMVVKIAIRIVGSYDPTIRIWLTDPSRNEDCDRYWVESGRDRDPTRGIGGISIPWAISRFHLCLLVRSVAAAELEVTTSLSVAVREAGSVSVGGVSLGSARIDHKFASEEGKRRTVELGHGTMGKIGKKGL